MIFFCTTFAPSLKTVWRSVHSSQKLQNMQIKLNVQPNSRHKPQIKKQFNSRKVAFVFSVFFVCLRFWVANDKKTLTVVLRIWVRLCRRCRKHRNRPHQQPNQSISHHQSHLTSISSKQTLSTKMLAVSVDDGFHCIYIARHSFAVSSDSRSTLFLSLGNPLTTW